MRKFQVGAIASLVAVWVGCADQASDDAGQSEGAVSAGTQESGCSAPSGTAIVTTVSKVVEAPAANPTDGFTTCSLNVQTIKVLGLKADVQTKINAKLASVTSGDAFSVRDCTDPFDISGSTSVSYNKDGLLSVSTGIDSYYAGAAHPSAYAIYSSFDLATGELLQLGDIVETDAKELVKAEALKSFGHAHFDNDDDKAVVRGAIESVFARPITSITDFTITAKGLRFSVSNALPHAYLALGSSYLVPWRAISAKLKNTPSNAAIRALANRSTAS